MASLTDLPGSAQAMLDSFTVELEARGVVLPKDQFGQSVRYIAPGIGTLFAWDKPCLALVFDSAQQGIPGTPSAGNLNAWELTFSATFNLVLLRDVATLNESTILPMSESITADATVTMTDGMHLLLAAVAVKANPPEYDHRQLPFVIGSVMSVGPEGGIAGNLLQVTVVLS